MDNLTYNKINKDIKNNYIRVMGGYHQDLPVFVKLMNNYIVDIRREKTFIKTSGKEQPGVAFSQTKEKDTNDNKQQQGIIPLFPL